MSQNINYKALSYYSCISVGLKKRFAYSLLAPSWKLHETLQKKLFPLAQLRNICSSKRFSSNMLRAYYGWQRVS